MKRCLPLGAVCRRTLIALAFGPVLAGAAHAQTASNDIITRVFPPNAQRGELKVLSLVNVELNGKPERLSAGARIRDRNNRIVMSSTLIGQEFDVNYTREATTRQVHEVWVLTPDEAARPRPKSSSQ